MRLASRFCCRCQNQGRRPMETSKQSTGADDTSTQLLDDMKKLTENFQLPGVDVAALVDWQRKDMETLVEANGKPMKASGGLSSGATRSCKRRSRSFKPPSRMPPAARQSRNRRKPASRAYSRCSQIFANSPKWKRSRATTPGRSCRTVCRKIWPICRSCCSRSSVEAGAADLPEYEELSAGSPATKTTSGLSCRFTQRRRFGECLRNSSP